MPPSRLNVLFEDNHLLVVNKPAGLPTQGAAEGEPSLCEWAKEYLKEKYNKPGNVYVGVVSRVDSLVTGVVVLARTSKGAARLSDQFRTGEGIEKTYLAIVEKPPPTPTGICEDYVWKDDPAHRMRVVKAGTPGGQLAKLSYETLKKLGQYTLLEVHLETGRKHQIRLQLAERGCAILGDRKYGAKTPFPDGIALHSRRLTIMHPTKKEKMTFEAPVPASWPF
jgi:23S rRNA pseudouridine1911/1915/1917 synthase